jgi:hypothetical protein
VVVTFLNSEQVGSSAVDLESPTFGYAYCFVIKNFLLTWVEEYSLPIPGLDAADKRAKLRSQCNTHLEATKSKLLTGAIETTRTYFWLISTFQ